MIYCNTCNVFFCIPEEKFNWTCPKCGQFTRVMRCTRCGHTWVPRNWNKLAGVCPKCKSPYVFRERTKEIGDD